MRSKRGLLASIVFLLAVPVAGLYEMAVGSGAGMAIHGAFALGAALMSGAVFDFRTPRWAAWPGSASIGALALVFFLQGASELVPDDSLRYIAYQVLGQRLEGWLVDLFMAWCVVLWVFDKRAVARLLGLVSLAAVACVEAYARGLAYHGTSLDEQAPILKLLWLLPFVWLLLESGSGKSARAALEPGR